jgi:hypothetical protein
MGTKILILITYNSRRITAIIVFVYIVFLLEMKRIELKKELPDIYIFLVLIEFYLGLNIMTREVKFLNKKEIDNHTTFQKITSKRNLNIRRE